MPLENEDYEDSIARLLSESEAILAEEQRRLNLRLPQKTVAPVILPEMQVNPIPEHAQLLQQRQQEITEAADTGPVVEGQIDPELEEQKANMDSFPWYRSLIFPVQSRGPVNHKEFELAVPGLMKGMYEGVVDAGTLIPDIISGKYDLKPDANGQYTERGILDAHEMRDELITRTGLAATMGITGVVGPTRVAAGMQPAIGLARREPLSVMEQGASEAMRRRRVDFEPPDVVRVNEVTPKGPPDLWSLEKASDQLKAFTVEDKQVLHDLASRAGMPDYAFVKEAVDLDTQTQASIRVNAALVTGKMRHIDGDLIMPVTPGQLLNKVRKLPKEIQDAADDYMKQLDYSDDLRNNINAGRDVRNSQMQLNDAVRTISDYEERYPIVKDLASDYRAITASVREFLAKGENRLMGDEYKSYLDQHKRNYVPFDISNINKEASTLVRMGQASQEGTDFLSLDNWLLHSPNASRLKQHSIRTNSFDVLNDWVANAARYKLENDTRGKYLRGMMKSEFGAKTIREANEGELKAYPNHVVSTYVNGEKKYYLASQLQAGLLQFDPYIAKYPNLYTFRRGFEYTTTGALSLTFAPKVLIRDSVAGWVFNNNNVVNPLKSAVAIPQMAYAKLLQGGAELLEKDLAGIPYVDAKAMSEALKHRYATTLYHAANEAGGFEASLMQSKMEASKGIFQQIYKDASEQMVKASDQAGVAGRVAAGSWRTAAIAAQLFHGGYDILLEAPRFAAVKSLTERGVPMRQAVVEAKKITGDTSRQGRTRTEAGKMLGVDAVDPHLTIFNRPVGLATEAIRDSTPYFNPMVQGLRKAYNSYNEDPVGTASRYWLAVGLPTYLAFAHNESLGPEYNDYAQQLRSSRDQVMKVYIGRPGLPKEEGWQIDLAHELTPLHSLLNTALYHMARGKEGKALAEGMVFSTKAIAENVGMVGIPPVLQAADAARGVSSPDSLLSYGVGLMGGATGSYTFSEDNVGFLPETTEKVVRSLFGGLGAVMVQTGEALSEHGPQAGLQEFGHQLARRTPLIDTMIGSKTAVTNFTPDKTDALETVRAVRQNMKVWDEWFAPDKDYTRNPESSMAPDKGAMQGVVDPTTRKMAPPKSRQPTNPVFADVGRILDDKINHNDIGWIGLDQRMGNLTEQLGLLRSYVAGDENKFREYQAGYMNADKVYDATAKEKDAKLQEIDAQLEPLAGKRGLPPEQQALREELRAKRRGVEKEYKTRLFALGEDVKAQQIVKDLKLDLGDRYDVNRLISYLEQQRSAIVDQQLRLVRETEDSISQMLIEQGLAPKGYKFDIKKDWRPY